jgi:hypothetical protein
MRSTTRGKARPDGKGDYLVTLPRGVIDRLAAMRGPGESYSDVIIRIARGCSVCRMERISPTLPRWGTSWGTSAVARSKIIEKSIY